MLQLLHFQILTLFATLAIVNCYSHGGPAVSYTSINHENTHGHHVYSDEGYGDHVHQNYATHGLRYKHGAQGYSNLVNHNNHYSHGYTGHALNHANHGLVYAGYGLNYGHHNSYAHEHDYHHVSMQIYEMHINQ